MRHLVSKLYAVVSISVIGLAGCGEATDDTSEPASSDAPAGQTSELVEAKDFEGAQITNDGSGPVSETPEAPRVVVGEPGPPQAEELRARLAEEQAERPAATSPSDPTAIALEEAAGMGPDETIALVVELEEVPFDFSSLNGVDQEVRRERIEAHKRALEPAQERAAAAIAELGGEVLNRFWVGNRLAVEVPAERAEEIAARPFVEALYTDSDGGGPDYHGTEYREAMLSSNFDDNYYYGDSGAQDTTNGSAVKVAVIEYDNEINTDHVGWEDWSGGPSRIARNQDCTWTYCTSASSSSSNSHGTRVSWVVGGNIEQNQDSNISSSSEQAKHSGNAREVDIYYYSINGTNDLYSAMQDAIGQGVDVVNMSFYVTCGTYDWCDPSYNCSGLNDVFKNALDAGIVPIQSAGNTNNDDPDSCSLNWPSFRPDVVSVSALNSRSGTDYRTSEISDDDTGYSGYDASEGPIDITTRGGISTTTPGLDIAAPGHISHYFTSDSDNYGTGTRWGTSYASPGVAGGTAMIREAFDDIGWSSDNARALMTNLFLMGDRSDGTSSGYEDSGVSAYSGYGRLRMHWPHGDDMTAPWRWAWKSFTIEDGETVTWDVRSDGGAVPTGAELWKWTFHWFDDDLTNTSDITISVYDVCPDDGSDEKYIAGDASFALRKQIRLESHEIEGKCLEMRAKAYDVPEGGKKVYSAHYYDGGDIEKH